MKQFESQQHTEEKSVAEKYDLSFEKKEYKPNVQMYIFKYVVVTIDTTGKNYKELPELLFGTYDTEYGKDSINQPEIKRENVDMEYVSACIREVSKDSGIKEFWVYPHGQDVSSEEDQGKREEARFRLFRRYWNLTPTENKFGYILKVE